MNWKEIKEHYKMTVKILSKRTGVPKRTLEDWIAGRRTPPEYITKLIIEKLEEKPEGQKKIEIAKDDVIDIWKKGKETISWTRIEEIEDELDEIEEWIDIIKNFTDDRNITMRLDQIIKNRDKIRKLLNIEE